MKKKLIICGIMALCIVSFVNAEMKYYSDLINGYKGYAQAFYVGTTKNIDPKSFSDGWEENIKRLGYSITYRCRKLTNQQSFLIRSAINEYDLLEEEVYMVQIKEGADQYTFTVVIKNNNSSFEWYGGVRLPQI